MKILFFASSFKTGVTVLLTEHLTALVKQPGVQILAVAGQGEQEPGLIARLQSSGIQFHTVDGLDEHREINRLSGELANFIVDFAPDLIMTQTNWQLVVARLAAHKAHQKSKFIYWIHGYRHNCAWKSKIALPLIGLLLRFFSHRVIASSKTVLHKFSPWVGKKKMSFLPLGVDQIFFNSHKSEPQPFLPVRLVFAGQFRQGKQQDWIVRAVAKCRQEGYQVEAVLPGDGPRKSEVMHLATELNIDDAVSFPGNLTKNELILLYHKSTLGVVPSNNETFGSCIAEPMVCGLPLLTRPVGCAADIIEDGKNGFFFSTEDELVSVLKKILNDPDLYWKAKSNINQVISYFDWNRICQQELSIFNVIA